MALKVLSGLIIPRARSRRGGSVTISLANGRPLAGGGGTVSDRAAQGTGDFVPFPAKSVALRRIGFISPISPGIGQSATDIIGFNLNDAFVLDRSGRATGLRITWSVGHELADGSTPAFSQDGIQEISFLIIGDAN